MTPSEDIYTLPNIFLIQFAVMGAVHDEDVEAATSTFEVIILIERI